MLETVDLDLELSQIRHTARIKVRSVQSPGFWARFTGFSLNPGLGKEAGATHPWTVTVPSLVANRFNWPVLAENDAEAQLRKYES